MKKILKNAKRLHLYQSNIARDCKRIVFKDEKRERERNIGTKGKMAMNKHLSKTTLNDFLKRFYLFIFRERRKEKDREGEKHQCVFASSIFLTGDVACNPGLYPDWESYQQLFGSQVSTQSTEPQQQGCITTLNVNGLNAPIKRDRIPEWIKNKNKKPHTTRICTVYRRPISEKRSKQDESEGMEKIPSR